MPETSTARAIVLDPRPLFGNAVRAYLNKGGHTMLSQVLNLEQTLEQIGLHQPNLVIIGPHLADSSLAICREINQRWKHIKLIIFTAHANDLLFQADAAYVGVAACLTPDATDEECLNLIEQVMDGQEFFSREIVALGAQPIDLSTKELQVLKLLSEGKTDREIAQKLGVQVSTIHSHAQHILEKLNVHTRQQAVMRARSRGLI